MPCCKAEEYRGWCKDEPTVKYRDESGNEFCVFHAPKGEKGITLKEFNEKVFKKIDEAKGNNEQCDLRGTVFEGDVDFSKYDKANPLPDISFTNAQFSGDAGFDEAQFSGDARFYHAQFSEEAEFDRTKFSGGALFNEAQFSGYALFHEAQFSEEARFDEAHFSGDAVFHKAQFSGQAGFNRAKFSGEARFDKAAFEGKSIFIDTGFEKEFLLDDAIFTGDTDFRQATFGGVLNARNVVFGMSTDFTDSIFEKKVWFTDTVFGEGSDKDALCDFKGAEFRESVDFLGVAFWCMSSFKLVKFEGIAVFHKTKFKREALLNSLVIEKRVVFEEVDISLCSFLNTDIRKFDLIYCTYPKARGNDVLYDESLIDWNSAPEIRKGRIIRVQELYRKLKQKYQDEHNAPSASLWHINEKEMFRHENTFRLEFPFSFTNLYRLLSGYGEVPERAMVWLLAFLFAGFMILTFHNIALPNPLGETTSMMIDYITFKKPDNMPTGFWGGFLKVWFRLVVPLQAALFGFALRNRFRR